MSSINCPTSKVSEYVDYHLQLLVKEISSHVENTNDSFNEIKDIDKIPEETYLVTMDVKSFYTNIPISEGVAATKRAKD